MKPLRAKEPLSYPSSLAGKPALKTSTSLDQRHRQQLIKQVRLDWIDGVLNQSLYKIARIELGLVEHPLNTMIRSPERQEAQAISPGISVTQIFEDQAGAVLILGGPGTGKTTILLELARDLLAQAERDPNQPIPAVFNLSSWAVRRPPLREWLIAELHERSNVPKIVATAWVDAEQIIPLLDGLDEVAADHRDACVGAINNFRREYGLLPIAVCSRIADYEALGTKLRLRNAIEVQPLTRSQVKDYLERVAEPVQVLRAEPENDPSFWGLLETPLMLWVALLSYRDAPPTFAANASLEQRRRHLFAYFVKAMFRRRGGKGRYNADQITRWLSSLACTLAKSNQTVLYLESLDFDWLPTRAKQWWSRGVFVVASGLIGGLIVGPILGLIIWRLSGLMRRPSGGPLVGPLVGLFIGLLVGLIGAVLKLEPVERVGFAWTDAASRKSAVRRFGLIGGLAGLALGLGLGLVGLNNFGLGLGLRVGLVGLFYGLGFGLIGGLTRLFTLPTIPETRSSFNEGTHRSIKMASVSLLLGGLLGGLIGGLLGGLIGGLIGGFIELLRGLLNGLLFGLLCAMTLGGGFALKHIVLRLFLWKSGSAPIHYAAFAAQAKDLLFLRQVGGGYIFVHRMLRDYFASLVGSEKTTERPFTKYAAPHQ